MAVFPSLLHPRCHQVPAFCLPHFHTVTVPRISQEARVSSSTSLLFPLPHYDGALGCHRRPACSHHSWSPHPGLEQSDPAACWHSLAFLSLYVKEVHRHVFTARNCKCKNGKNLEEQHSAGKTVGWVTGYHCHRKFVPWYKAHLLPNVLPQSRAKGSAQCSDCTGHCITLTNACPCLKDMMGQKQLRTSCPRCLMGNLRFSCRPPSALTTLQRRRQRLSSVHF